MTDRANNNLTGGDGGDGDNNNIERVVHDYHDRLSEGAGGPTTSSSATLTSNDHSIYSDAFPGTRFLFFLFFSVFSVFFF